MEDLDKKLDAVINDLERLTLTLGSLLGSDNETYIEQIKQAFLDAGWFVPADKELIQSVVNMRAQQKADSMHYGPDLIPIQPKYTDDQLKTINEELSKPRMTGREWYDKFIDALGGKVVERTSYHEDDSQTMVRDIEETDVLAAAKKAAGIE